LQKLNMEETEIASAPTLQISNGKHQS